MQAQHIYLQSQWAGAELNRLCGDVMFTSIAWRCCECAAGWGRTVRIRPQRSRGSAKNCRRQWWPCAAQGHQGAHRSREARRSSLAPIAKPCSAASPRSPGRDEAAFTFCCRSGSFSTCATNDSNPSKVVKLEYGLIFLYHRDFNQALSLNYAKAA